MIKTDSDIFLHIPDDSGERILHPGKVVEVSETFFAAAFEEEDLIADFHGLPPWHSHPCEKQPTPYAAKKKAHPPRGRMGLCIVL